MKQLSAQAKYDRKRAQKDLYYLNKVILGYDDMVEHVHGDACVFYTHPKYGRFRQITFPRSWFKTVSMTVGGAIWLSLPDEEKVFKAVFPFKGPNVRTLIASNIIDNAAKMVHMLKLQWEKNDRLRAAFPDLVPEFNKVRWSDHCAELSREIRSTEGTYTAIGVGGGVISQHFDVIIEDDLIYAKKDDFTGQELMPTQEDIENAIGWHKLAFSLLVDPKKSCIFNIGTRWAPHDLIDYIRKHEKHYHCFEVAATRKDEAGSAMWPIPDDSYCFWPERYDKEALDQIRATQGAKIFECFPAEAPILMSDWTTKAISDVSVGDTVVGFEKTAGKRSKLIKATVNLLERQSRPVVKLILDNGGVIRCTPDHPWYTGRLDKSHKLYKPASVGSTLLQVYSHNPTKARVRVLSIEPDGVETVYAIGTTSGNYVAYGYATKNTQYLNRPRAGEDVTFDTSYLVRHQSLDEYPQEGQWETYVDLAGWSDKKNLARNVILTGKKDYKNHLWVARYDAGRYNPSEIIQKFKEHQRQFNSRVKIEEIQYQRSIRHFATLDMELDGAFYNIDPIPYDGRKDAKNLRIRGLEPAVRCGAVHILQSMDKLVSEMEDYPYSATVDILDCLAFLQRFGKTLYTEESADIKLPFSVDAIEEELHEKANSVTRAGYPFECQLSKEFNVVID